MPPSYIFFLILTVHRQTDTQFYMYRDVIDHYTIGFLFSLLTDVIADKISLELIF